MDKLDWAFVLLVVMVAATALILEGEAGRAEKRIIHEIHQSCGEASR